MGDNLGEAEEFLNIDMNVALFFFFSVCRNPSMK